MYLGQIETDPQKLYRELHATAIALNQAKDRFMAARTVEAQRVEIVNVSNLRDHFAEIAARFRQASAEADPQMLTVLDRVILSTGIWVEQVYAALPSVLTAIPRVAINAIGDLWELLARRIGRVGGSLLGSAIPWGVLAVGAVALLLYAERSRTVRKAVARA